MAKPTTTKPDTDALLADIGKAKEEDIAGAVGQLSPEEAAFFLAKLEAVITKRKLQLTGYLVALVAWAITTFLALLYVGTHDGFVGWVFLVPFFLVGVILFGFGKWADRVGKNTQAIIERDANKPAAPDR